MKDKLSLQEMLVNMVEDKDESKEKLYTEAGCQVELLNGKGVSELSVESLRGRKEHLISYRSNEHSTSNNPIQVDH